MKRTCEEPYFLSVEHVAHSFSMTNFLLAVTEAGTFLARLISLSPAHLRIFEP